MTASPEQYAKKHIDVINTIHGETTLKQLMAATGRTRAGLWQILNIMQKKKLVKVTHYAQVEEGYPDGINFYELTDKGKEYVSN